MHGNALTSALTLFILLLQTYGNTTCEGDRGLTGVTQISCKNGADGQALTSQAACLTLFFSAAAADVRQHQLLADRCLGGAMHATTPACVHGKALTPPAACPEPVVSTAAVDGGIPTRGSAAVMLPYMANLCLHGWHCPDCFKRDLSCCCRRTATPPAREIAA
jgi:hypothetical protein